MENHNEEKVEIRLSEVIMLLEEGNTREQIAEHFGLNKAEVTMLFQHEKLKGKRPKKVPSFTITDDLGGAPASEAPTEESTSTNDESFQNSEEHSEEHQEEVEQEITG